MITLDLRTLLVSILLIAIIVFVVYLTIAMKNLIITLKNANKVLEDANVVSSIVADKATRSEVALDKVLDACDSFSNAVKGEEGVMAVLGSIAKAITSIASLFKKDKEEDVNKDSDIKAENQNVNGENFN